MPEKPKTEENLLKAIVDHQPEQFEQLVLALILTHPNLTLQVDKLRDHMRSRDPNAQLFSVSIHDTLAEIIGQLRRQLMMAPLVIQAVTAGIAAASAAGRLLQAELDPLVRAAEQAVADQAEAEGLAAMIMDIFPYWAELRVREFYARRISKQESLETIARQISEDLATIRDTCSKIEEGDDTFLKTAGFSFYILAPPVTRYPTPVPALTAALGGGFARREGTLVLAPQGAGKTVMACQLGASLSLQGLKVMLISTEEGQVRMDRRVFANLANLDYGAIKDAFNYTTVSPQKTEEVERAVSLLGGRLQYADWLHAGNDASIVSEAAFSELIARKEKELTAQYNFGDFDVVMLDWVGSALGSFVELTAKGVPLRHLLLQAANNLCEIAKKQNKIAIIFTQATAGISYNKKRIDMSCLSECKDMSQKCANVLGISALYEKEDPKQMGESARALYSNNQWICVSKSRFGEGGEIPVTRNFRFMRFEKR